MILFGKINCRKKKLFVLDCKPHRSLKPRRNELRNPTFTIVLVILGSSLIANYTQTCFDKLRQIGIQGMMWETSKSRFSLEPATLGQNNSKDF
jgi:hypothetical protein